MENFYFKETDIQEVLGILNKCILGNKYKLENTRESYLELINKYFIDDEKIIEILLRLTPKDFVEAERANNPKYNGFLMYKFVPKESLLKLSSGEVLEVYLYVKFSLPGESLETQETMVISLHRGSKPKEYYFI